VIHKPSRHRPVEFASWPPDAQDDAIAGLLELVEDSAPAVAGHMRRTARLARAFVQELGLGEPLACVVVLTARLHDIGKLGIPPWVLEKEGPLSEFELRLMRGHSLIGQEMLERRPELIAIGPLVRATHERWDGTGYPDGLRGPAIPLPSRIVAVCDAFDAMTRPRSYSESMPIQGALDELEACAGTQFDPGATTVFRGLIESRFARAAKEA
jgi:two-component system, cell cycle response regulator